MTVYGSIFMRFSAFFFQNGSPFQKQLHVPHFLRQMAPQIPRNGGQKLRKVQKSADKFVRTMQKDLKKKSLH